MRAVVVCLLVPGSAFAGGTGEPEAAKRRDGTVVEAGIGPGFAWFDGDAADVVGVGFAAGVGGWVTPSFSVSVLASGVRMENEGVRFVGAVLGPSLQYWPIERAWIGGGIGVGFTVYDSDEGSGGSNYREPCAAFRLRAGVNVVSTGEHTFGISAELAPMKTGLFDVTTASVLLSYQYR